MIRRILLVLCVLGLAAPLMGCVVEPYGYYGYGYGYGYARTHAAWVPGHWNGWRWVPGHWV